MTPCHLHDTHIASLTLEPQPCIPELTTGARTRFRSLESRVKLVAPDTVENRLSALRIKQRSVAKIIKRPQTHDHEKGAKGIEESSDAE